MSERIGLLLHTDRRHGVARYARELAAAASDGSTVALPERHWTATRAPDRIHAHFTDRLWGPSPEAAADRLLEVAGTRWLGVTLHDLPQPSDGTGFARRTLAYLRVVDRADVVVVNSRHERALLDDLRPESTEVAVIPLPVHSDPASIRPRTDPAAALLGWVYPGKGHREVIEALAEGGSGLSFRALGAPSPGHESDADDLVRLGERLGVEVTVTGYLTEPRLRRAATAAAVPVIAHQHLSASGSINSWIAAGRRPVAIRSRYTEEMEALRPGTLRLTTPEGLGEAIAAAALDPASTRLPQGHPVAPRLEETVAAYLELWRGSPTGRGR